MQLLPYPGLLGLGLTYILVPIYCPYIVAGPSLVLTYRIPDSWVHCLVLLWILTLHLGSCLWTKLLVELSWLVLSSSFDWLNTFAIFWIPLHVCKYLLLNSLLCCSGCTAAACIPSILGWGPSICLSILWIVSVLSRFLGLGSSLGPVPSQSPLIWLVGRFPDTWLLIPLSLLLSHLDPMVIENYPKLLCHPYYLSSVLPGWLCLSRIVQSYPCRVPISPS